MALCVTGQDPLLSVDRIGMVTIVRTILVQFIAIGMLKKQKRETVGQGKKLNAAITEKIFEAKPARVDDGWHGKDTFYNILTL